MLRGDTACEYLPTDYAAPIEMGFLACVCAAASGPLPTRATIACTGQYYRLLMHGQMAWYCGWYSLDLSRNK